MFDFFKEFDEEIYDEITNEVLFNMWNDSCIPNIQSEIEKIVKAFGCITVSGGRHQLKIVHRPTGTVIPIPSHGDTVAEAYIKEIKALLDKIKGE